jgi:hypothetical protein
MDECGGNLVLSDVLPTKEGLAFPNEESDEDTRIDLPNSVERIIKSPYRAIRLAKTQIPKKKRHEVIDSGSDADLESQKQNTMKPPLQKRARVIDSDDE